MYCCKCGKTIPDEALFCSYCGSRQQAVCSSCGTVLAADAAFCHKCGTQVNSAAAAAPAPKRFVASGSSTSKHVYGCSEKQNDMVYVEGKGLYYLYDCNLYLLSEGESTPKNLTRYHNKDGWSVGLNYYNEALWFNRHFYSAKDDNYHNHLVRYDVETGEKGIFIEDLPVSGYQDFDSYHRMIVRDGLLYYIWSSYNENYLMVVNLDNGAIIKRELPKLRNKDVCDEWKTAYREACSYDISVDRPDDTLSFAGLYLHGDYGYAVHAGYAAFNIRFRLDDPSKFEFLPFNSCSAYKREAGMISVYHDDTLVGCGGCENEMFATTPVGPSYVGETVKHFSMQREYDTNEYQGISGSENGHGWWRVGSRYFLNRFMVDMEKMEYRKLPFSIFALDFHEMPDGSVWIRGCHSYAKNDRALYHLPANCWEKIRMPEELDRYRVCYLGS